MAGFIYIMSNPAFPNLLKIGKSKKDPTTDRVNELNQTGVPEPFKVEYYAFVEDEDYLERAVHQKFASQRPNKNREFFSVDCVEAIDAIRQLSEVRAKIKYEEVCYVTPEELTAFREQQKVEELEEAERRTKEIKEWEERQIREAAEAVERQKLEDEAWRKNNRENMPYLVAMSGVMGLCMSAFLFGGGIVEHFFFAALFSGIMYLLISGSGNV